MVVFNESNISRAKIDKLISMLGQLFTQSKPFKPGVYQGRRQALTNSGRGDQYHKYYK